MVRTVWIAAIAVAMSGGQAQAEPIVRSVGDVTVELSVELDAEIGTVVGRSADAAELWRIQHAGVYYDFAGAVVVGDRLVYADYSDLLVVDVRAGRIIARHRMPWRVVSMRHEGDGVLTLQVDDAVFASTWPDEPRTVAVRYRLGDPPPGRGPSGMAVVFAERRATSLLPTGKAADELTTQERQDTLAALDAAIERDRTNVYLFAYRALLLDRTPAADDAYRRASDLPGAQWSDLLRLAEMLDHHGRYADAARAFDRGYAGMKAAGARPELQQGLVTFLLYGGRWSAASMREAIDAGDVERADTIMTRRWRVSPKLEGGPLMFRVFARWLRDQGHGDRASTWEDRAAAAEDGWIHRLEAHAALAERVWVPLVLGLLLAIPLCALLLGIRVANSDRRVVSLLVGILLIGLPIVGAAALAGKAAASHDLWRGLPIVDDASFGSSGFVTYLEDRAATPERDEVLAWARREAEAQRAGGRYDGPVPGNKTIAAAVAPSHRLSESVDGANLLFHRMRADARLMEQMKFDTSPAYVDVFWEWDTPFEYALVLVLPLLLGLGLGRLVPRAARCIEWLIPGGARSLSVASGLLIGAFCAAVLVVVGYLDEFWSSDSFAKYLGLEEIWGDTGFGPSTTWAYLVGAAVIVVQLAAWLWHRRCARRGRS